MGYSSHRVASVVPLPSAKDAKVGMFKQPTRTGGPRHSSHPRVHISAKGFLAVFKALS